MCPRWRRRSFIRIDESGLAELYRLRAARPQRYTIEYPRRNGKTLPRTLRTYAGPRVSSLRGQTWAAWHFLVGVPPTRVRMPGSCRSCASYKYATRSATTSLTRNLRQRWHRRIWLSLPFSTARKPGRAAISPIGPTLTVCWFFAGPRRTARISSSHLE